MISITIAIVEAFVGVVVSLAIIAVATPVLLVMGRTSVTNGLDV